MRESHQSRAIDLGTRTRASVQASDTLFELGNGLKRGIPSRFQFARNKAPGRVNHLVATRSQSGGVARLFELVVQRALHVSVPPLGLLGSANSRLHRMIGNRLQDLRGHGAVNAYPADANARRPAPVTLVATTEIAVYMTRSHPVEHPHHPTTAAASHQSSQQRAAIACRSRARRRGRGAAPRSRRTAGP